ncbi:alpha/beta hydrolase [Flavobacterium agrisoli]|uniref:Alpha/beta hydrolase n=1 Tax=Flavobacterium agrisoli TaxID=2793066 RepID=A0A934PK26_9FLAO|nr:alpha/beta hydrolase [Flavobacterium agrisoli]MBK0368329.1 alpha/beta hydrolase [Flavobacterium agrisoli]
MEFQPLKYVYIASGIPNAITLLLFHGTGGDENDLLAIGKNLGEDFNILSVRGNVLEHGMPRFFRRIAAGIFDEEDLKFRTHELVHFLKSVSRTENFNLENLIAVGYSNGANIAGSIVMLYPNFLSGAILFRPMMPYKNIPSFKSIKKTPILIISGDFDTMVPLLEIELYKDVLTTNNFIVTLNHLKAGHNLVTTDISLAKKWLIESYMNRFK